MNHCAMDSREYIRKYLERFHIKQIELARRMARSPAWVSQMLARKRPLTLALAKEIGEALGMSVHECVRLQALVESEQVRTVFGPSDQDAHFSHCEPAMVTNLPLEPRLDSWQLTAIYQLTQCEDFQANPGWIAATLRPQMTEHEARLGLTQLQQRGLIGEGPKAAEDQARPSEPIDDASEKVSITYHHATLDLAKWALKNVPGNDRTFVAGCVALSEEDYLRFQQQLEALVLHTLRTAAKVEPNRVYHLNVAVFPISLYSDSAADPRTITD